MDQLGPYSEESGLESAGSGTQIVWQKDRSRMSELSTEDHQIVECVVRHAPQNAQIVELGCGTGQVAWTIATHLPGARVIGIDGDEEYIAECKKCELPNLSFRYTLLKDWDMGVCVNDMVVFSNVIEHLLNPGGVLLQIHRSLKTGGG